MKKCSFINQPSERWAAAVAVWLPTWVSDRVWQTSRLAVASSSRLPTCASPRMPAHAFDCMTSHAGVRLLKLLNPRGAVFCWTFKSNRRNYSCSQLMLYNIARVCVRALVSTCSRQKLESLELHKRWWHCIVNITLHIAAHEDLVVD